jgi:hypothetical protein
VTEQVVWHLVKRYAAKLDFVGLAPHDLRPLVREAVPFCRRRVGTNSIPLGHVSVQTTERYLACKQLIRGAVNDRIGIEP